MVTGVDFSIPRGSGRVGGVLNRHVTTHQMYTNTGWQVTVAYIFLWRSPIFVGPLYGTCFMSPFSCLKFLRWFLDSWKTCASCIYIIHVYVIFI